MFVVNFICSLKVNNLPNHDPLFNLNNAQLQYVEDAKYLGLYIHKDGTFCDVKRQMRKIYANINMMVPSHIIVKPRTLC